MHDDDRAECARAQVTTFPTDSGGVGTICTVRAVLAMHAKPAPVSLNLRQLIEFQPTAVTADDGVLRAADSDWRSTALLDCGANVTISGDADGFEWMAELDGPVEITLADGDSTVRATHYGLFTKYIHNTADRRCMLLRAHNALYTPGSTQTLISTATIMHGSNPGGMFGDGRGGTRVWVTGGEDMLNLMQSNPSGDLHLLGTPLDNGLHVLKIGETSGPQPSSPVTAWPPAAHLASRGQTTLVANAGRAKGVSLARQRDSPAGRLAHARAGHPGGNKMNALISSGKHFFPKHVPGCRCDACVMGIKRSASFPTRSPNRPTSFNERVSSDTAGPFVRGFDFVRRRWVRYFTPVVDEWSRWTRVWTNADKTEFPLVLDSWCETEGPPSALRTDNGTELSQENAGVRRIRLKWAIRLHITSCTYTPPQNGVAESAGVQRAKDEAHTLLAGTNLDPDLFWAMALIHAVFLLNRWPLLEAHPRYDPAKAPKKRPKWMEQSAFELRYGHAYDWSLDRIFGCRAYVQMRSPKGEWTNSMI